MAQFFIGIAGLVHIYIFVIESLLWGSPFANRIFGFTEERALQNHLFAFNQGFYNLFLAIEAVLGIVLSFTTFHKIGITLMAYAALSMVGAALVLIYSQKKLYRAALIQGLPPFLGLVALAIKFL